MNDVSSRLDDLGRALYAATRADLGRSSSRARKRRRMLIGLGAAAVLIPATALAGRGLLSTDDVAESLPAGTLALVGTNPTCEVVVDQVEYHCVLDRPRAPIRFPAPTRSTVASAAATVSTSRSTQTASPGGRSPSRSRRVGGASRSRPWTPRATSTAAVAGWTPPG